MTTALKRPTMDMRSFHGFPMLTKKCLAETLERIALLGSEEAMTPNRIAVNGKPVGFADTSESGRQHRQHSMIEALESGLKNAGAGKIAVLLPIFVDRKTGGDFPSQKALLAQAVTLLARRMAHMGAERFEIVVPNETVAIGNAVLENARLVDTYKPRDAYEHD